MYHLEGGVHLYYGTPDVELGPNVDDREANSGAKLNTMLWTPLQSSSDRFTVYFHAALSVSVLQLQSMETTD